jgi:phage baseplate assembly protein W
MITYAGFSSSDFKSTKKFFKKDIDLVKQDLYNNIMTRYGERVKMPTFGTSIPDLVFEPLDDMAIITVQQELTTVFNYDPRVKLVDLQVIPLFSEKTILALATLTYLKINFTETVAINIQFQN